MSHKQKTWRNYEELAAYVLRHFADVLGISEIEAKQRVMGTSGTQWEIDAKGIVADGFLVIECRERTMARLNQDAIGALAFKVADSGAKGAVIITSTGLQKGAKKIAYFHDFKVVYLPKEGTIEQFFASCGNKLMQKVSDEASSRLAITSMVVNVPDQT